MWGDCCIVVGFCFGFGFLVLVFCDFIIINIQYITSQYQHIHIVIQTNIQC